MTQYPTSFNDPYAQQWAGPKPTSGMSITALVVGIVPCLGLLTAPIGVVLGIVAFFGTGPSAAKKGRGLAVAAVLLGVLIGGVQVYATKVGWDFFYGFYEIAVKGPDEALRKGAAGDLAGFKSHFHGAGATATDAEAKAFLDELQRRYGAFQSCAVVQSGGNPPQGKPGQPSAPLPYVLTFANASVDAEAEVHFADQKTGQILKKLGYIKVFDSTNGDLVYPASAAASGSGTGSSARPAPPESDAAPAEDSDSQPGAEDSGNLPDGS